MTGAGKGAEVRNWRVLTAVAAVVLAALAGVLVWKYTDNAKDDAKKPYEQLSVLVAAKAIPANTTFSSALQSKLIERDERTKKDLPDAYVNGESNDATLAKQFDQLVAAHSIAPGETITSDDFVSQGESVNGVEGQIQSDQTKLKTKDLMAITVTLDDTHSVGGFVTPGDTVNVAATVALSNPAQGSASVKTTAFLMPGVKVIAVGSTTTAPQQQSGTTPTTVVNQNRSLLTFEVNSRQALQLVQAQAQGTLYLTLNPSSFKATDYKDPGEIVEAVNLFDKPLPLAESTLQQLNAQK